MKTYIDMMRRMADILKVPLSITEPKLMDVVHSIIHSDVPLSVLLSILPVHLGALKEAWDKPASVAPIPKKAEAMYHLQQDMGK